MVTRAEFVQAIRNFKRKHGGKLKDLLNQKSNPETVKAFWSDPVIQTYLARPSVTFVDKHPQLHDSTTKEEHETTDHYELKTYKYLPNVVVYRDETINSSKFYMSVTRGHSDLFSKLLKSFSHGADDIEVGAPCDIYEIRDRVGRHFLTAQGPIPPRFLINANWKDRHASTCVTIFDSVTRRQLITLFMNSFQSTDYYEYLKIRFLTESSLRFEDYPEDVNERAKSIITKTFSIDVDGASLPTQPSLLINQKNGAAFTINYLHSDYNSGAYKAIEQSPEIETIYSFMMLNYKNPPVPVLRMKYTPKTPFIDVSHHLQQDADDLNCALYSMNFIQAVVEMLKQPEIADRVVELARAVKSDPSAIKTLVHIFQEDLKAYLPCYYDTATGVAKSHAEVELLHLNQRWEIGGKSVSMLHPLELPVSTGSPANESNTTSEKTTIAPSSLENNTLLNTTVPKLDLLAEQDIQDIKDQPSVILSPNKTTNNNQLDELSIQNKASAPNTRMEYNDAALGLINQKIEFLQKIQAMQKYGILLKNQNASKGQVAIDLANALTIMANQFFEQDPEKRNFAEFKPKFSTLLHSKDLEMSTYRISWGTIVANIAIALTGIGLLFIAGKLIHSKVTEGRALFFFQQPKTTCEGKIADIRQAVGLIAQMA